MTERKISSAIKRSQQCIKQGYHLEGLLKMYHLNNTMLNYIAVQLNVQQANTALKPVKLIEHLITEIDTRPALKSVIPKKNLKSVRPWFVKMDGFFKTLKRKEPANANTLHSESEQVLAVLKIATTKLLISNS